MGTYVVYCSSWFKQNLIATSTLVVVYKNFLHLHHTFLKAVGTQQYWHIHVGVPDLGTELISLCLQGLVDINIQNFCIL